MDLIPGTSIGLYRLIEQIGMGGMATVYKAYHAAMDRHVALKMLPRQFAKDETYLGRFHQEARTIANLEHPHILPVYDFGEDDGYTYLVMRLLEAGTLKERMGAGPLSISELDHLFGQVTSALDYAHSRSVIHRDVKPSNVLIDPHGNAFLTDFGVAKLLQSTSQFTASGGMLGTPAYMAPEQGKGSPSDARSDLYALGVMLYEMCTGRIPFDAETPLAIVLKHINDPLPLPRNLNESIPEEVQDVILKAMAKEPDERYQTANEMLGGWRRAVGDLAKIDKPFGPELVPPRDVTQAAIAPETVDKPEVVLPPRPKKVKMPPRVVEEKVSSGRRLPRRWWLAIPVGLLLCACIGFFVVQAINQQDAGTTAGEPDVSVVGVAAGDTAADEPGAVADAPGTAGEPNTTGGIDPFQPGPADRSDFTWESFANANEIRSAVPVGDVILTATGGGIVVWDTANDSFEVWSAPEQLPFNRINSIMPGGDGVMWIGTEFGLLRRAPDGELAHFSVEDGLDSDWVGPMR